MWQLSVGQVTCQILFLYTHIFENTNFLIEIYYNNFLHLGFGFFAVAANAELLDSQQLGLAHSSTCRTFQTPAIDENW